MVEFVEYQHSNVEYLLFVQKEEKENFELKEFIIYSALLKVLVGVVQCFLIDTFFLLVVC